MIFLNRFVGLTPYIFVPEPTFNFKQFSISQDKCAMKVSTDSVLFGACIQIGDARTILDIGTGTGLLSLMLAQRSAATIDAIDVDEEACLQAKENIQKSNWSDKVNVFNKSLQDFMKTSKKHYDLIISNPPYFVDAYIARADARSIARHMNDTLTMDELIRGVNKLLDDDGKFWLILPYKEGMLFYGKAFTQNLFCNYIIRVRTKIDKHEKRLIMCFSKKLVPIEENEIVLQDAENNLTDEYINRTSEYYMNLKKQHA